MAPGWLLQECAMWVKTQMVRTRHKERESRVWPLRKRAAKPFTVQGKHQKGSLKTKWPMWLKRTGISMYEFSCVCSERQCGPSFSVNWSYSQIFFFARVFFYFLLLFLFWFWWKSGKNWDCHPWSRMKTHVWKQKPRGKGKMSSQVPLGIPDAHTRPGTWGSSSS